MNFHPLKDNGEAERAGFWDKYSDKFVSIANAPSSNSLLIGNTRLCRDYLTTKEKGGKILKLDLWDEAHHTATISHVYHRYDEVHAIDISPDVVEKALVRMRGKGMDVKGVVGDMRALPYPDHFFDYVFTMGTIEHIPRPIEAMREIYRVLKPGGRAVIGVPNKYEWFGKSIALNILADMGIKEDGREHSYGWGQLTRELESCGFEIVKKDGPYFMPWIIRAADWFFAQHHMNWGSTLLLPVIKFCDWLSHSDFLLRNGGLLAPVVQKPWLDRTLASELAQKFDTPLFVTSKSILERNIKRYRDGFNNYRGKFTLCYSTKTNSQLEILNTMKKQGVVAEVCSHLDMSGALKVGYTGESIIYEGLVKTDEELDLAVRSKFRIINIESMDEAERLEKIAQKHGRKIDVGIRLAFPSKTGIKSLLGVTYDRFGSSVKSGQALRVAEFIIKSPHLNLIGLHCHTGSNQMTVKKYLIGIDLVTSSMKYLRDKHGIKISIINLGGGVGIPEIVFYSMFDLGWNFIKNALRIPIVYKSSHSFDFEGVAAAMVNRLHKNLDKYSLPAPEFMMEPGRALVGNSTDLLLKTINVKKTDVSNWIIVDGGTNLLPVLTLFSEYHNIEVCNDSTERQKTSMAGPLLYSADILTSNRLLPPAKIGDLVILRDVGAYCVVQANQFLYPRAGSVMVDGKKSYIIQTRETVDDVLAKDVIQ